jgi:choline dehydrogenase-like flavoprotein
MIIDGNTLNSGTSLACDLCIVGSGAVGMSIAAEFKSAGRSVILIESGRPEFDEEVQALNDVSVTDLPVGPRARVRQVGGSTTAWSGKWLTFAPADFERKPWLANTGWPLRLEELEDYYVRASVMHRGPAPSDYVQFSTTGQSAAGTDLLPVSVYWLHPKDLDFSLTVGRFITSSQTVSLYYSVTATNIVLDDALSAVSHIEAVSAAGAAIDVRAAHFVLAAGGIENPRLLLASNRQSPNGVGNTFDNVGRYFMDHPKGSLAHVQIGREQAFPQCLGITFPRNGTHRLDFGMRLSDRVVERERLVSSYVVWRPQTEVEPSTSVRALFSCAILLVRGRGLNRKLLHNFIFSLVQVDKANLFSYLANRFAHKIGLRSGSPKRFRMNFHIEQEPRPENRITLSDRRDRHGQPLPRLESSLSKTEIRSIKVLHESIDALLAERGCGMLVWDSGAAPEFRTLATTSSSHHCGTTRMGLAPEDSVVDPDCRVHGIDNLYIGGSSVFPTASFANPTFTLVALAIRLADNLKVRMS